MERIKNQYRQGDVLLERVDESEVPPLKGMRVVERDRGRVVLAYGEATGHAHSIDSDCATLYALVEEPKPDQAEAEQVADRAVERFLKIVKGGDTMVALHHQQHPEIELPPGTYKVTRQSEYTPEAIRTVAD
jgi:hypothetical protein